MSHIIVALCQVLGDCVDTEAPDAASKVFFLADDFFVEAWMLLWQPADEQRVRNEQLLRNFDFRLSDCTVRVLSVSRNAESRHVLATVDRHVMPQSIVDFHGQRDFFAFAASDNEDDVPVSKIQVQVVLWFFSRILEVRFRLICFYSAWEKKMLKETLFF